MTRSYGLASVCRALRSVGWLFPEWGEHYTLCTETLALGLLQYRVRWFSVHWASSPMIGLYRVERRCHVPNISPNHSVGQRASLGSPGTLSDPGPHCVLCLYLLGLGFYDLDMLNSYKLSSYYVPIILFVLAKSLNIFSIFYMFHGRVKWVIYQSVIHSHISLLSGNRKYCLSESFPGNSISA